MSKLKWISDENLLDAVSYLLERAKNAQKDAINTFGRNVVDPFSAAFEMSGFNMTYDEWLISETSRQSQKTLQNFIGDFHQILLGSCQGWRNMGRGNIIDLLNEENKVVAEVKNKFNTISGGKLADLYWSLESAVMNKTSVYKGFTAYYVSIIPDKPKRYNIEFTPSDKEKGQKCPHNPLIRQIDGASFYDLVTGDSNGLRKMFSALPLVIKEYTKEDMLDSEKLKKLFEMAYGSDNLK
jgi:hypothetical protein